MALTPSGIELRDALYLLEDSPDIADANLNLRRHRLLDRHDHALDPEALLRLASDRSVKVRVEAARALMDEERGGDRSLADRLATNPHPKVRAVAAPYADPHLFLGELNPEVIRAVVRGGRADDVCRERWTSPDEPFEIRLAAGALVTDGEEADRMLDAMEPDERVMFLGEYPRLAVGERAANACRATGDDEAPLEYSMTRVPDDYLREALESKTSHWGLKSRVEDYRRALREAMRPERRMPRGDRAVGRRRLPAPHAGRVRARAEGGRAGRRSRRRSRRRSPHKATTGEVPAETTDGILALLVIPVASPVSRFPATDSLPSILKGVALPVFAECATPFAFPCPGHAHPRLLWDGRSSRSSTG